MNLGTYTQYGDGYMKQRLSFSPVKLSNGGGLSSWECCYGYTDNYWSNTIGARARAGVRFRGYASYGNCSPRYWFGYYSAGYTSSYYGGSAQARIKKRS